MCVLLLLFLPQKYEENFVLQRKWQKIFQSFTSCTLYVQNRHNALSPYSQKPKARFLTSLARCDEMQKNLNRTPANLQPVRKTHDGKHQSIQTNDAFSPFSQLKCCNVSVF